MPDSMSKTERVHAALKGQAVDRVPVSAWWHDYEREWSAEDLASMTLEAYRKYDWDFIKVNPRFSYYAEDWGASYTRYPDRLPTIATKAIESPEDLSRIKPLSGTDGAWAEQLEALRLIADGLKGEAPFMQTVFTPLAVVSFMTGSGKYVRRLMDEAGDELETALDSIAQTLAAYSQACLEAGSSGIFFAGVEWGSADNISWELYERFGKPYDLPVLEAVKGAPFNVLHVCREHNYLLRLLDYPVAAFHWDANGTGNPGFAEVLERTDKAVAGGVRQATMLSGNTGQVAAEAKSALDETKGSRFLLAPGCSIDPASPEESVRKLVEAARS
jgi:uroporphyrinogen decarboxylase